MLRPLVSLLALGVVATAAAAHADDSVNVGMSRRTIEDPVLGVRFPVTIWFPTRAPARPVEAGPYTLDVAPDAPVADGRHAVIVISHGSGGSMLGHYDTALALARHGYIVAAPLHPGDNYRDQSGTASSAVMAGRPRQLSLTIDLVLHDPALAPHVAAQRIGAIGHSAGGYTVLALLGAQPDVGLYRAHCRQHPDDLGLCQYGGPQAIENAKHLKPGAVTPDRRIRAAVLMAPLGVVFSPAALAAVHAPVRIYAAAQDDVLLSRYNADIIRAGLHPPPEFVLVEGAGHYSFVAPFPPALRGRVGPADHDPPGFDRVAFHARLDAEIVGFFDRKLK